MKSNFSHNNYGGNKKNAAKPTGKSATKPSAAKKTAAQPTTVKATELSVTGNKKIITLQKEFNKKFPYLRLGIFYSYARQQVAKGESITDSGGGISISGNKRIGSLEKEFDTVFGLYCQICYTDADGRRYYTSGCDDTKTLFAFNKECENAGCKKGVFR